MWRAGHLLFFKILFICGRAGSALRCRLLTVVASLVGGHRPKHTWASVAVVRRPSSPEAYGTLPGRDRTCVPALAGGPQPLDHQEAPFSNTYIYITALWCDLKVICYTSIIIQKPVIYFKAHQATKSIKTECGPCWNRALISCLQTAADLPGWGRAPCFLRVISGLYRPRHTPSPPGGSEFLEGQKGHSASTWVYLRNTTLTCRAALLSTKFSLRQGS